MKVIWALSLPGKTAPVTEPPAGANVVDYMDLIAQGGLE